VSVEMLIAHLTANTKLAKDILAALIPSLPASRGCACGTALRQAILTARGAIPGSIRKDLAPIIGAYV